MLYISQSFMPLNSNFDLLFGDFIGFFDETVQQNYILPFKTIKKSYFLPAPNSQFVNRGGYLFAVRHA